MAAAGRTYVDFEPPHSLLEEGDKVVLRIDLAAEGFKKEQLRVQIDNFGRLRISGERPLRADSDRWRRFSKDFHVPEGCDAGTIRARLDKDGVLLITMSRLSPTPAAGEPTAGGVDAKTAAQQEAPAAAEAKEENMEDAGETSMEEERRDQGGAVPTGRRLAYGFAERSRSRTVWAVAAGVLVLVVVGAGLYARYGLIGPSVEMVKTASQILALADD